MATPVRATLPAMLALLRLQARVRRRRHQQGRLWRPLQQYLELRSRIDDICPTNFYLPSRGVWDALIDALGGSMVASGTLKEAGTSHWGRGARGIWG